MSRMCLESAGLRLKQLRQQLEQAEQDFRLQYEDVKRSVEEQLRKTRHILDENERRTSAQLVEAEGSSSDASEITELRRIIDETTENLRTTYTETEAMMLGKLAEAAEIIATSPLRAS